MDTRTIRNVENNSSYIFRGWRHRSLPIERKGERINTCHYTISHDIHPDLEVTGECKLESIWRAETQVLQRANIKINDWRRQVKNFNSHAKPTKTWLTKQKVKSIEFQEDKASYVAMTHKLSRMLALHTTQLSYNQSLSVPRRGTSNSHVLCFKNLILGTETLFTPRENGKEKWQTIK